MSTNSYSRALYELANEANVLQEIEFQSKVLLDSFRQVKDFKNFIINPISKKEDHLKMIESISNKLNVNNILEKFLKFLVSKRRLFYLEKILNDFLIYCSHKRGEVEAKLISSKTLTDKEIENIKTDLSKNFGSNINLNYKVDKSLLAGLIIQVGSIMIDNSLKNKLKIIKTKMIET